MNPLFDTSIFGGDLQTTISFAKNLAQGKAEVDIVYDNET